MKNIRDFLSENFQFLVAKCSVYLNRHVFVMQILKNTAMTQLKQRAQWRPEARIQENHKQDHDGPNHHG